MTKPSLRDKTPRNPSSKMLTDAAPRVGNRQARHSGMPTDKKIQREISLAVNKELSAAFEEWAARYAVVGRRNAYLWKWCRQAVEITTLPCVPADCRPELCDAKALGVMWDVLLDDVADRGGDGQLLEDLLTLPLGTVQIDLSRYSSRDQAYAKLTCELWEEINRRARRYPRYLEFKELLRFDYLQLCNVMRYSHLLNANLNLLNLAEHDAYTPQNMHIMICSTLDLMCSPTFDSSELGKLREAVWRTQYMGRIGNLTTTWQREIGEGDFTSGVFARAVMCGDLDVDLLRPENREALELAIAAGGHEEFFLRRWQQYRKQLLSKTRQLRSFDMREYVGGFERLICLHLGSRGYK